MKTTKRKKRIEKIKNIGLLVKVDMGGTIEGLPLDYANVVSEYGLKVIIEKINKIIDKLNSK